MLHLAVADLGQMDAADDAFPAYLAPDLPRSKWVYDVRGRDTRRFRRFPKRPRRPKPRRRPKPGRPLALVREVVVPPPEAGGRPWTARNVVEEAQRAATRPRPQTEPARGKKPAAKRKEPPASKSLYVNESTATARVQARLQQLAHDPKRREKLLARVDRRSRAAQLTDGFVERNRREAASLTKEVVLKSRVQAARRLGRPLQSRPEDVHRTQQLQMQSLDERQRKIHRRTQTLRWAALVKQGAAAALWARRVRWHRQLLLAVSAHTRVVVVVQRWWRRAFRQRVAVRRLWALSRLRLRLRVWVRDWRARRLDRAADIVRHFAQTFQPDMLRSVLRFRARVIRAQRAARGFILCHRARLLALTLAWQREEARIAKERRVAAAALSRKLERQAGAASAARRKRTGDPRERVYGDIKMRNISSSGVSYTVVHNLIGYTAVVKVQRWWRAVRAGDRTALHAAAAHGADDGSVNSIVRTVALMQVLRALRTEHVQRCARAHRAWLDSKRRVHRPTLLDARAWLTASPASVQRHVRHKELADNTRPPPPPFFRLYSRFPPKVFRAKVMFAPPRKADERDLGVAALIWRSWFR